MMHGQKNIKMYPLYYSPNLLLVTEGVRRSIVFWKLLS